MNWGNPYLLFLILLIPIFIILLIISNKFKKKSFRNFADSRFFSFFNQEFSNFNWNLKAFILIGAILFMIIAIARPKWDKEAEVVKKEGLDIVVCIDVSKSMNATDIQPSRIERAKDQISLFIDNLKGDRIATVAFAGRAKVQCPLTNDYGAAKLFLNMLDTETVGYYGTDIGDAIGKATDLFSEAQKYKVIIIVSDGEDLEDNAIKMAKKAARQGAVIYALGVGSPEGSTIPIENKDGSIEYAKDKNGEIVMSKLDVSTLSKLAEVGNGKFYSVTPQQSEIYEILRNINSMEKEKIDSRQFVRYKEQYKYFVLAALILLIIEQLIIYGRKRKLKRTIS